MSKKPIILHDYGREEYLDGAMMRYTVRINSTALAYFRHPSDARLFADAKAARAGRSVMVSRDRPR